MSRNVKHPASGNVVRRRIPQKWNLANEYDDKAERQLPKYGRPVADPTGTARSSKAREAARCDLVARLVLAWERAEVACDAAGMRAAVTDMEAAGLGSLAASCRRGM
jgi:hypothetical protein